MQSNPASLEVTPALHASQAPPLGHIGLPMELERQPGSGMGFPSNSFAMALSQDGRYEETPTKDHDAHCSHNAFDDATLDTHRLDQVQALSQLSEDSHSPFNPMLKMLRTVPHFYMLPTSELQMLAEALLKREYGPMDHILDVGATMHHIYIVLDGSVEAFYHETRVGTVEITNVWGFESLIFGTPTSFCYHAGSKKTVCGLIPEGIFVEVLNRNVPLRQSIGRKMAERMDVFFVFKEFCKHIFSVETTLHEYLPIWHILDAYQRIGNCIHGKMSSHEIDTGGWMYAIRRLPNNVTHTFCFELARSLPPFVASRMKAAAKSGKQTVNNNVSSDIRYIATADRRRCSWQLGMDGKTVVLLRDSFTDVLDFVSCLCMHIMESIKLRARLQGMVSPPAIDLIDDFLHYEEGKNADLLCPSVDSVLHQMPLSSEERKGLKKIWGKEVLQRIYEVLMHREEYMLRVDSSMSRRYQMDPFHEWALNLRAVIMKKLGLSPTAPLPDALQIDILSSNTHCTKNCLSAFPRIYRSKIMEYGRKFQKEIMALSWHQEEDLLYFLIPKFINEYPEYEVEFGNCLTNAGFDIIEDTALTGLQVDVLPVACLDRDRLDPLLDIASSPAERAVTPSPSSLAETPRSGTDLKSFSAFSKMHSKPGFGDGRLLDKFILNMDFAFGGQADGITKALVTTFGHRIRSFNVMGKAGGLVGDRGDIQLATHVLFSKSSLITEDPLDELRSCGNEGISQTRLQQLLPPDRKLHVGPVLTIPGTMLQNEKLLKYYRTIWKCVGVEMEGSYFARQIRESQKLGLLRPDLYTRFAYYTSDLPLRSHESSLSTPMQPNEGVPPVYAISRMVLELMLRE